jgi:general secretion pathway protein G
MEGRWSARGAEAFAVLGLHGDKALTILAIIFLKSKQKAAGLQIKSIQSSLELYYIDTGNYPSEAAGLAALVTPPSGVRGWAGPYIDSPQALDDPWGRAYIYKSPGETRPYEISTLGRDGREGGTGEDRDVKY